METDQKEGVSYFWSPVLTKDKAKTFVREHFGTGIIYNVPTDIKEIALTAQLDGGCSNFQIILKTV